MKLQSFLINMVYWMFAFSLLKHSKTATEKVAFFLSLTVYVKSNRNQQNVLQIFKIFKMINEYLIGLIMYVYGKNCFS